MPVACRVGWRLWAGAPSCLRPVPPRWSALAFLTAGRMPAPVLLQHAGHRLAGRLATPAVLQSERLRRRFGACWGLWHPPCAISPRGRVEMERDGVAGGCRASAGAGPLTESRLSLARRQERPAERARTEPAPAKPPPPNRFPAEPLRYAATGSRSSRKSGSAPGCSAPQTAISSRSYWSVTASHE